MWTLWREGLIEQSRSDARGRLSRHSRESLYTSGLCVVLLLCTYCDGWRANDPAGAEVIQGTTVALGGTKAEESASQVEQAIEEVRDAAEQGDADACFLLACRYVSGDGVSKSLTMAAQWYQRAAMEDHSDAQYHLGLMYYYGLCVQQSDSEAIAWFQKASSRGNEKATQALESAQIRWAQRSEKYRTLDRLGFDARRGDTEAQYNMGMMYVVGSGAPKNFTIAVKWLTAAAERGSSDARKQLDVLDRAFKRLHDRAREGDAAAQFDLGIKYLAGDGVPQDLGEAMRWLRKSAAQGYGAARDTVESLEEGMK